MSDKKLNKIDLDSAKSGSDIVMNTLREFNDEEECEGLTKFLKEYDKIMAEVVEDVCKEYNQLSANKRAAGLLVPHVPDLIKPSGERLH